MTEPGFLFLMPPGKIVDGIALPEIKNQHIT